VKLISDRKTGKCRGFGFVTVKTDEQADAIVEKFNGFSLEETELKVEKALPRSKAKEEAPSNDGGNRRKATKAPGKAKTAFSDTASAQPDPRWAQDLAKLKEMLAAQTTSS
jgi:RNA recognition motif-containing protein